MVGVSRFNARSFSNNKDWKQQVMRGQNATYSYSRTGIAFKVPTWSGTSSITSFGVTEKQVHWGSYLGADLVDSSDDAVLKDIALARLKNKLSSNIGNASLLPPLGESHEIHGLIRDINTFTTDALKALIAIKKTRGKSVLKMAGKIWLFFNFGVKPLISDVAKAAEAIQSYKERSDHSQPIHGSASKIWRSGGVSNISRITNSGVTAKIRSSATHQLSYRYKGSVQLTIRSDASYGVLDHLGLTFSQLPNALWELTAYSWVVDYFTTVGPWLDDVFYTLPGSLKYLSLNTRYENECIQTIVQDPIVSVNLTANLNYQPGWERYFSFTRASLTTLPTRGLRIRSFDEIGQYGLSKVLNLASVLAGRLDSPRL